jgi:hypothetical protein
MWKDIPEEERKDKKYHAKSWYDLVFVHRKPTRKLRKVLNAQLQSHKLEVWAALMQFQTNVQTHIETCPASMHRLNSVLHFFA